SAASSAEGSFCALASSPAAASSSSSTASVDAPVAGAPAPAGLLSGGVASSPPPTRVTPTLRAWTASSAVRILCRRNQDLFSCCGGTGGAGGCPGPQACCWPGPQPCPAGLSCQDVPYCCWPC